MMTIWSVDPITDRSSAWGVGVTCIKESPAVLFVRASDGAE
jgi:hypothetical protein